jgi:iron-sulfur cluster assembly protein
MDFPVSISPEALEKLKAQFERKGPEGGFVRIGVKGGGCSGLEYVLKFDSVHTPYDIEQDFDGLRVVSDTKSSKFLQGATLVWTGNLVGGFQFDNPNADRQCGCGTSFTPKKAG